MKKLFYLGIIPGLFIQFIGAYLYFIAYSQSEFVNTLYSITKIFILIWPAIWVLILKYQLPNFPTNNNKKESLKLGIISGICIAALTFIIFIIGENFFQRYTENIREKAESFNFLKPTIYITFSIFLSIIHSLIEEYYWRWFIFKGLLIKFKPLFAAVIGSIAFASHHFIVLSEFFPIPLAILFSVTVMLGGLLWCFIYYKTNNILGNWISHFFVDAAILTIGYILLF